MTFIIVSDVCSSDDSKSKVLNSAAAERPRPFLPNCDNKLQQFGMFLAKDKFQYPVYQG